MKITESQLRKIIREEITYTTRSRYAIKEGWIDNALISSNVQLTPTIQKIIDVFKSVDPEGKMMSGAIVHQEKGLTNIRISSEFYYNLYIGAEYGSYPSIGGDYEIGYTKREKRTERSKYRFDLLASVDASNNVVIKYSRDTGELPYDWRRRDGNYLNILDEKILSKSRGFGATSISAVRKLISREIYEWADRAI